MYEKINSPLSDILDIQGEEIISLMAQALKEMPKDHLIKWVLALESGAFAQGHNQLIRYADNYPKYCCLGLYALRVLDKAESDIRIEDGETNGVLPDEWAEHFAHQAPFFCANDGGVHTIKNVTRRWPEFTFKEIAQLIRKARSDVFPS